MKSNYAWFKRRHPKRSITWQTKTIMIIIKEAIKANLKVVTFLKIKVKGGSFI